MSGTVYSLGFWSNEKRDQQIQSYRDQGHDERTAQLKTRADEMKDLERDPGYRQAAAEDRVAAQEAAWDRDRAEAQRDAARMAAVKVQERQREQGRGR